MNAEIIYPHGTIYGSSAKFQNLTEEETEKIDNLARLMQSPDTNFNALRHLWETEKSFRLLIGGLL